MTPMPEPVPDYALERAALADAYASWGPCPTNPRLRIQFQRYGMLWLVRLIESVKDQSLVHHKPRIGATRGADLSAALIAKRLRWYNGLPCEGDDDLPSYELARVKLANTTEARAVMLSIIECADRCAGLYYLHNDDEDEADFPWMWASDVLLALETALYRLSPPAQGSGAAATAKLSSQYTLPWQDREAAREYVMAGAAALPWASTLEPVAGHYAHVSTTDEGMVAFTASERHGERGRHTIMKPGRYLKRYYPALSNEEIERMQAAFDRRNAVQFARTPAEIAHVYRTGPQSCMAGNGWDTDQHPTEVFGLPGDVTLAYLVDAAGTPTARTLVWEDEKVWMRMYGDHARLAVRLEGLGYSQGSFEGARIHRIEVPMAVSGSSRSRTKYWLMPYLDRDYDVVESGDDAFWLMSMDGEMGCQETAGYTSSDGTRTCRCTSCGDRVVEEDSFSGSDGETYCESCFDELFTTCDRSGATIRRDGDAVEVVTRVFANGTARTFETWSIDAFNEHGWRCELTDTRYSEDVESAEVDCGDHIETWCLNAAENNAVFDEATLRWFFPAYAPASMGLTVLPSPDQQAFSL